MLVKNMTVNSCNYTGDYLQWTNMKFNTRENEFLIFEFEKKISNQNATTFISLLKGVPEAQNDQNL